jgi:hypothetical protein
LQRYFDGRHRGRLTVTLIDSEIAGQGRNDMFGGFGLGFPAN